MRNRSNIVIGGVLVVAAAVAYWLALNPEFGEGEAAATPSPVGETTGVLWDIQATDVTQFEIRDTGAERATRLERQEMVTAAEDQWIITAPVESLADQFRVQSAVSGIANLIVTRTLTETTDLEPYGVLAPSYILKVFIGDGADALLAMIGDVNPSDNAYYVLREGEEHVVLVGKAGIDALIELIDMPPYHPTPTPAAPVVAPGSDAEPSAEATPTP